MCLIVAWCAVHDDTPEGRAVAVFKTIHAEQKEQAVNLTKAKRTFQAILDYEKARTGSTNGKKSQLQHGIRNANEYRGAM
jgi:hypothetical protein